MAMRRIRTILNGDQTFSPAELELLHTPALQRLYDLHQLGLTDRVYVDASHCRLQHVIGAMHQADKLVSAIVKNMEGDPRVLCMGPVEGEHRREDSEKLAAYVEDNRGVARLMALLHDLTHAPYGHTLEDEVRLVDSKHDHPDRQADAFYRLLCQLTGWLARDNDPRTPDQREGVTQHPPREVEAVIGWDQRPPSRMHSLSGAASSLSRYLDGIELYGDEADLPRVEEIAPILSALLVPSALRAHHIGYEFASADLDTLLRNMHKAMSGLLYLELLHKHTEGLKLAHIPRTSEYSFQKLIRLALQASGKPLRDADHFDPHKDAFLLDLIGNTICADLLDYARRDAHFTNLKIAYDPDRIVENFTLVSTTFPLRRLPPCESSEESDRHRTDPFAGSVLRPAITVFGRKLKMDVPSGAMDLLQARFDLYERALYHPTKCVAGAMLGRAIQLLGWQHIPANFKFLGDQVFLHQCSEAARFVRDLLRVHLCRPGDKRLTEQLRRDLAASFDTCPDVGTLRAARDLLDKGLRAAGTDVDSAGSSAKEPELFGGRNIPDVLRDLDAAIRLLDRLASRRYHRVIFRLLPDMSPDGPTPLMDTDKEKRPVEIASEIFGDRNNRHAAELEIERLEQLPRGSVVIHCPQYSGPAKIAEVLLYARGKNGDETRTLRRVAGLKDNIFKFHGEAVQALERMYRSTWRLTVSVAPPYHRHPDGLAKTIEDVLKRRLVAAGRFLHKEDVNMMRNDPAMVDELALARQRAEVSRSTARRHRKAGIDPKLVGEMLADAASKGYLIDETELAKLPIDIQTVVRSASRVPVSSTRRIDFEDLYDLLTQYGLLKKDSLEIRHKVIPEFLAAHRDVGGVVLLKTVGRYMPPLPLLAARLTAGKARDVLARVARESSKKP